MKSTAFLVYRPVLQYEESMTPLVICSCGEIAETVKTEILRYAKRLAKRLPEFPSDEEDDPEALKWAAVSDKREKIFKKARWPYAVDLKDDITSDNEIDDGVLDIMQLPSV
jgi:hypothetical protein